MIINPFMAGRPFSPTDISGLLVWLKADALSLNDGDAVSSWTDSSGNGTHATQGTALLRPVFKTSILNSLPILRFNGSQYLQTGTFSGGQPATFFAVPKFSGSPQFAFDGVGASNRNAMWSNSGSRALYAGSILNGSSATANFEVWSAIFNSTSSTLWVNGTSDATGDIGTQNLTNGLVVGAAGDPVGGGGLNGDLAEVIIYNSALSSTNRQLVEDYLGAKYGITIA